MPAQVVPAADVLTGDEGLRRGLDVMPRFEGVGLLPALQPEVVDLEPLAFQQRQRLSPVGADVVGRHHAVELSGLWNGGFHRWARLRTVSSCPYGSVPRYGDKAMSE